MVLGRGGVIDASKPTVLLTFRQALREAVGVVVVFLPEEIHAVVGGRPGDFLVEFTDVAHGVAGVAQQVVKRRALEDRGLPSVKGGDVDAAVLGGPLSGEQAGAGRAADRCGREGVRKIDALGGETIEMRRAQLRVAVMAEAVVAVLIGMDQQDVGTVDGGVVGSAWHEVSAYGRAA